LVIADDASGTADGVDPRAGPARREAGARN
jgi:hypothetical protein